MRPAEAKDTRTEPKGAAPGRVPRGLRAFLPHSRGATAIEFAILAAPFFALVFAILETSTVFLAEMTLDRAVDQVGRELRTGEVQRDGDDAGRFRSRLCAQVDFLMDCAKLAIDVKAYGKFSDIPSTPPIKEGALDTANFGFAPAGEKTIMALRVYYRWPIYTDVMRKYLADLSDGSFLVASVAAFRTEPFE
ncbi:TadE/TadG family type IV pilus assembly protein [Consotaella salsifontis]|uniref:Flp pilus assembly protein TadG n=1 Tax=Consotaella salsifontis TaxID=1365950 RepID=A0A1T4S0R3_9HYPH|nr:TadE/TadG family type IV pilus assembly protein [Consotaella salsifontis]SKA21869.1 Flp pilus assembly protein TadG [Consotaella salsifontis]